MGKPKNYHVRRRCGLHSLSFTLGRHCIYDHRIIYMTGSAVLIQLYSPQVLVFSELDVRHVNLYARIVGMTSILPHCLQLRYPLLKHVFLSVVVRPYMWKNTQYKLRETVHVLDLEMR